MSKKKASCSMNLMLLMFSITTPPVETKYLIERFVNESELVIAHCSVELYSGNNRNT